MRKRATKLGWGVAFLAFAGLNSQITTPKYGFNFAVWVPLTFALINLTWAFVEWRRG